MVCLFLFSLNYYWQITVTPKNKVKRARLAVGLQGQHETIFSAYFIYANVEANINIFTSVTGLSVKMQGGSCFFVKNVFTFKHCGMFLYRFLHLKSLTLSLPI